MSLFWFIRSPSREPNNLYVYIYIFIVNALDETSILVAVQFSMQNIYKSYDLGPALWRKNVDVHQ